MTDIFSAHAGIYDQSRRKLIPCFDSFYGMPSRILTALGHEIKYCLDLGAGTGLLSATISQQQTIEDLVILDQSNAMLERGCRALKSIPSVRAVISRLQDIDKADLGQDRFDAIWSALAIHHLTGDEKQVLFGEIKSLLRPGGIFINADQSLGQTPDIEAVYRAEWLRDVRALGASEEEIEMALERMKEDRMDTLADQLDWLKKAGFSQVSLWFQDFSFNVYSAVRGE